jgi:hypothetical protein
VVTVRLDSLRTSADGALLWAKATADCEPIAAQQRSAQSQLSGKQARPLVAFMLQPVPVERWRLSATIGVARIATAMHSQRSTAMLETIAIILIVLWLLGMVSGYTLGNFIWILLVIAVVLFLVRLVSGRRVV